MLFFIFLVPATSAVGCKATRENPANEAHQDSAAAIQLDKAKAATKEAAQAMEDYAYARRAEFLAKMRSGMDATQEELDRLSAKVEHSTGAAKADAKARLVVARAKWTTTKQQLDQVENATESTWDDVKSGVRVSYAGLKDSIATTRLWLSDKIAP
jgi:acyl-CoA reductase-like NAD-dependent aldehyde dehydrogenase